MLRRGSREDASRLALAALARHAVGAKESGEWAAAGRRLCEDFRTRLTGLVGPAAFDALHRRALFAAQDDHTFLLGVGARTDRDTFLLGLEEALAAQPAERARRAVVDLATNLLWLLVILVGQHAAERLFADVAVDPPSPSASPGHARLPTRRRRGGVPFGDVVRREGEE